MTNHAIARLAERYSVTASADDIKAALADIRDGRSILAGRNGDSERHLVRICGVAVIAVIVSGSMVTVEPPCLRRRVRGRKPKKHAHA